MSSGDNHRRFRSSASRRTFIAALGGAGAAASLAGCAGILDDDDDPDPADDDDDPDPADDDDDPAELGDPVPELEYVSLVESLHPNRHVWTDMHTEELEDLGFEVNLEFLDDGAYVERGFVDRTFDLYPLRWGDGFDPDRILSDFFSEAEAGEGGGNVTGYIDSEYEDLLEQQRREVDPDARQDLVYQMQEKVIEDEHVITPMFVMPRPMPYNSERYQNVTLQAENGLASLWNLLSIEPTAEGDDHLIMGGVESVDHINPFGSIERGDRDVQRHVFDRLLQVDPDGEVQEWIAEDWSWPDDETVELTIRDDITWHDGEPLTAEDVVFSFEYSADVPAREGTMAPIENITAETDVDVTIELDGPNAPFEVNVLAGIDASLIAPQQWEDIDPEDAANESFNEETIACGPWEVDSFVAGEELTLEAHDGHFNPPNLERATRIQYADTRSATDDIETGAVDMLPFDIDFDDIDRLEQMDHIEVTMPQMTSIHYFTVNMREDRAEGMFANENVRRALGHAIPAAEANDVALLGTGELINTCFSPALEFWYNPDLEEFGYDMDAAESLLAEEGFGWEDGRIHYPADW